jgi:hypothetical protein
MCRATPGCMEVAEALDHQPNRIRRPMSDPRLPPLPCQWKQMAPGACRGPTATAQDLDVKRELYRFSGSMRSNRF